MKRPISLVFAVVIMIMMLAACSAEQSDTDTDPTHTLYFRDSTKSSRVTATLFNSADGRSEDIEMEKTGEDEDSFTFSCESDTSKYNMVCFTYDTDRKSDEVAFNKCVSGWYKTEDDLLPCFEGEETDYIIKTDDVTLSGYGYDKKIHIWTPDGYDASSKEKYSTVYMLDGQGMAFFGREDQKLYGCPVVTEQVGIMSRVTGHKAVVVLIESGAARDYEMVPKIGESFDQKMFRQSHGTDLDDEYDSMNGSQFAEFIAHTVAPYVQENYNVYTDALHTAISGASLGGLLSFYAAMEYPEIFGTVGALSPTLPEFDDETWREYLGTKSFDDASPFVYLFSGPEGRDVEPHVSGMYDRLLDMGYPAEKLTIHLDENCLHDSISWRNVFSEILEAMVYRKIEPLQQSAAEPAAQ